MNDAPRMWHPIGHSLCGATTTATVPSCVSLAFYGHHDELAFTKRRRVTNVPLQRMGNISYKL
jgi:hypothetical protein